jgi:hypothetical protein
MEGELRMPKYGEGQFGRFRYGRYVLAGKAGALKVTRATRIRVANGTLRVRNQRETIPGTTKKVRMRAGTGPWVQTQTVEVEGQTRRVRVRNENGPWVQTITYEVRGE